MKQEEITFENIVSAAPRKVFCKDCKWNGGIKSISWIWCEAPEKSIYADAGRVPAIAKSDERRNANGECPLFAQRRPWWKFWRKP